MPNTFDNEDICVLPNNVVSIWSRLSHGNREYLSTWIKAGRSLGLLDAEVVHLRGRADHGNVHVLIWVREAADAAYRVAPNGFGWTVTDNLRSNELSRHATFEAALEAIRPVFSFSAGTLRKRSARAAQRSKSMLATLGSWTAAVHL